MSLPTQWTCTQEGPGQYLVTFTAGIVGPAGGGTVSAAPRLLGRGSAGAGPTEEIQLGTNLAMSGTTLNASGNVSSVFARTGAVTAAAGDYTAAQVTSVPAGGLSATTVQAALNELDAEKLSANQTITLGGDVSGSGTTAITATIANDAVTYAKLQNVSATDRLLGRVSAWAGDVEEVVCTDQAQALLDDATAADMRATLGLGTAAVLNATLTADRVLVTDGTAVTTDAGLRWDATNNRLGVNLAAAPDCVLHARGAADGNAMGPLCVASDGGTVGVGVTLDAQAAGGGVWSFLSTGTGAFGGAGDFAVYNTATGYVWRMKPSGHMICGGSPSYTTENGNLTVVGDGAKPVLGLRTAAVWADDHITFFTSGDAVQARFRTDASWKPPQIADAAAASDSVYYSTTQGKLVYKDPSGVVQNLY